MLAGLVDWNEKEDWRPFLERMQQETGPFQVSRWRACHQRGLSLALSAEGSDPPGVPDGSEKSDWATFDGTLYNAEELVGSLGIEQRAEDKPWCADEDVVLAAYRRWGVKFLDRLVGDFALAIWDGTAKRLFAAVDPFGLRPFYYVQAGSCLAFASRLSQLRLLPWVGGRINDRMVVSFLTDTWNDADQTFYKNIIQLPPGHYLQANAGETLVCRYWRPGVKNACAAGSSSEVLRQFADLFRLAVRQRIVAPDGGCGNETGPVGILMSGGLDSTSLAGMAADIYQREQLQSLTRVGRPTSARPVVISAQFGDLPCDESPYIDAVLRRLPFESHRVTGLNGHVPSVNEFREDLRRHEWPALNRQRPLFEAFTRAAHRLGARMLLNGLGGDELATDYRYYHDLLNRGGALGILRAAGLVSRVEGIAAPKALYSLAREGCPEEIKRIYRWLRRRVVCPSSEGEFVPAWLAPQARRMALEIGPAAVPAPQGFGSATLELAWQIISSPYSAWANRWLVNEFASQGIRCRFPFLDQRLFDFVFSIPPRLRPRCKGSPWFKPLISQGLSAFLPPAVRHRAAKVHFEAYNCYVFGGEFESLRRCLFDSREWHSEGFVPRRKAFEVFENFQMRPEEIRQDPLGASKRIEPLRRIAGLELWLRES
jgi:asparagine synthase (glutamine-hydrolysing)